MVTTSPNRNATNRTLSKISPNKLLSNQSTLDGAGQMQLPFNRRNRRYSGALKEDVVVDIQPATPLQFRPEKCLGNSLHAQATLDASQRLVLPDSYKRDVQRFKKGRAPPLNVLER